MTVKFFTFKGLKNASLSLMLTSALLLASPNVVQAQNANTFFANETLQVDPATQTKDDVRRMTSSMETLPVTNNENEPKKLSASMNMISKSLYQGSLLPSEWEHFLRAYVMDTGRVVDNINEVTHSESQGYGLLMAFMSNDHTNFSRIWSFTQRELQVRDDGLLSWRWEADAAPHITDVNNATDGDILVAYALLLAGSHWQKPDYFEKGVQLVEDISNTLIINHPDVGALLLPGRSGFDKEPLILNPSYWVDEAFVVFSQIDPEGPWIALLDSATPISTKTSLDNSQLPPDWIGLKKDGTFSFTEDFNNSFSYNSIRVPLYHIRGGRETHLLDMAKAMAENTQDLDILNDPDPGYKAVAQLTSCVSGFDRTPIQSGRVQSSTYYGTVLELLSRSAARAFHPECIRRAP